MFIGFLFSAIGPILLALFLGGLMGVALQYFSDDRKRTTSQYGDRGEIKFNVAGAVLKSLLIASLIFSVMAAVSAYTTVEYQTVRAVKRFGNLVPGYVLQPRSEPYFITPFVDKTVLVRTNVQSYETSSNPDTSKANFRDFVVKAQTKDGQQIDISYTVLFSMPEGNDVTRVLETIGDMDLVVENVVKANSRSLTRLFAQSFDADDLYSGDSIFAFSAKVENGGNVTIAGDTARIKGLKEELEEVGVKFDQFLLRKIDFDTDYVQAIENKRIAFENITTQENNALAAEFEKQRTIREKEAEAQGVVLNAQAEAEQTRLAADAEAYAIEQKGGALRRNPEVLQWEMVGNLSGAKWIMPFDSVEQFIPVDILSEE